MVVRRKVRFPSKSVNRHGFCLAGPTLREEVAWHLAHSPGTRYKKISKIKFVINETREADGCVRNVHWGFGLALYNLRKILWVLGYKGMENVASQNGHVYRYNDVNEMVLNVAHVLFKDMQVPHLPDKDADDDSDDDDSALPQNPNIIVPPNPANFVSPPLLPSFNVNSAGAP